jgi:transcriptional regulator with XRE-family HTH domain
MLDIKNMTNHDDSSRELEKIAERLENTRGALGLSQSELCAKTGIQRNTYNQWERGKQRPGLSQAMILCETFGITLDWIYRGDPGGIPARLNDKIHH